MRRVITGDDATGKSTVIIDDGPSAGFRDLLFAIWEDVASGPQDPRIHDDLGPRKTVLGPTKGGVQVRWFVVEPRPEAMAALPKDAVDAAVRGIFAEMGAAAHVVDQSRHPTMHETPTLDVICVLQGEVILVLEDGETLLKPGNVVIQRGTNHAWQAAPSGPALLLAVLIDRSAP